MFCNLPCGTYEGMVNLLRIEESLTKIGKEFWYIKYSTVSNVDRRIENQLTDRN
jgi:hypothetical protein